MVSHPETGSDSPIGSDRDRGCDTSVKNPSLNLTFIHRRSVLIMFSIPVKYNKDVYLIITM